MSMSGTDYGRVSGTHQDPSRSLSTRHISPRKTLGVGMSLPRLVNSWVLQHVKNASGVGSGKGMTYENWSGLLGVENPVRLIWGYCAIRSAPTLIP
jgi:hypothetical protein